ncbi:hypothetical protein LX36DRAFT_663512, partial [Colletotrichum falcatum]
MHYTTLLFALPLVLADSAIPVSNDLCTNDVRAGCPISSNIADDNVKRCLRLNGLSLCVTTCSDCRDKCRFQGTTDGFCSNGANPCICSNTDASN